MQHCSYFFMYLIVGTIPFFWQRITYVWVHLLAAKMYISEYYSLPKVKDVLLRAVQTKLQYIHQNRILSPHKP